MSAPLATSSLALLFSFNLSTVENYQDLAAKDYQAAAERAATISSYSPPMR